MTLTAEYETYRLGKEVDGATYREADAQWFRAILSGVVQEQKTIDPVIRQALEHTDESITKAVVGPNSAITGRALGDSKIGSELALRIIAVRRGHKWIFNPGKGTETKEGDILIAVGSKIGCAKLRRIAKGRK